MSNIAPLLRQPNRLAREKSPYLLQHQHNPVDWFSWGEEAFARARTEDKPIFLSIGYSTCHWCHVMERESFEEESVAAFLNGHFVSIKVDREERPDVDHIYMTFVQATAGQGGWPLTVFLTPDLRPFYGGTYFPPDSRHGRPAFIEVLTHIAELWKARRGDVCASADGLHRQLEEYSARGAAQGPELGVEVLGAAAAAFKAEYDPQEGGFGGAPKFPRPSQPGFLLRHGIRSGDPEATQMVLHTCAKMAAGGICDQLGGGFARYSVDSHWLVPHFEKMLYDNAQLLQLYLDAGLVSPESGSLGVARDIVRYILRDMTHPEGGFYSAEDADSEGKEGKFYCWTRAELSNRLTPDEFKVAVRYFGITEEGNFLDHSDPSPLPGQNVLSIVDSKLTPQEQALLTSARQKMLLARALRIRPHLDDKILASWNGLMLGGVARAYSVLQDPVCLAAAEKNLTFLRARLWDEKTGTLYHRWREGEHDTTQLLTAYAFLLSGVLDLYEATIEPRYLEFAVALAESMVARFYDTESGGFWQSGSDASDLILRLKEDYDGAEPAGVSVGVLALLKLAAITGRVDFQAVADRSLLSLGERLRHTPQALPCLLHALDFSIDPPLRIVVAGSPRSGPASQLLAAAHSVYRPNKVILGTLGPVDAFARTLPAKDDFPVAYCCTGTSCLPPTDSPDGLRQILRRAAW